MLSVKLFGILAFGVIAGVGAVVNAVWGPRAKARRRLARGTRALAEGEVVTVVGKARQLGALLEAPLSGRSCIAHEVRYVTPNDVGAATVIHELRATTFELVTDDGAVLVEATDALELALPLVPIIPRRLGREQDFLEARGRDQNDAARSSAEEAIVAPGDRIAVQGVAVRDAIEHGERGYRDAPTRIRLVPQPGHPLTIGAP